ncbi:MAG TPA: ferrous iron transport protein A [Candidatus Ozemobacteraceae bacterium]|nr:ferrous iron transport protein A [Candidatus Ozemobacteraceae bacterium]
MVKLPLTLADVPLGKRARIRDIESGSPLGRRLLDLGFVPGTSVVAIRRAPFGDPIAVMVRGSLYGLRHNEARLIQLEDSDHE